VGVSGDPEESRKSLFTWLARSLGTWLVGLPGWNGTVENGTRARLGREERVQAARSEMARCEMGGRAKSRFHRGHLYLFLKCFRIAKLSKVLFL
jgi:hypothetical protein